MNFLSNHNLNHDFEKMCFDQARNTFYHYMYQSIRLDELNFNLNLKINLIEKDLVDREGGILYYLKYLLLF